LVPPEEAGGPDCQPIDESLIIPSAHNNRNEERRRRKLLIVKVKYGSDFWK